MQVSVKIFANAHQREYFVGFGPIRAEDSNLLSEVLSNVAGLQSVFAYAYSVRVYKSEMFDWDSIEQDVLNALQLLQDHQRLISDRDAALV